MSKYPWVPRDYYPAVMFACKMIRENGYFNKAIKTAAEHYGVDPIKLEQYVRARQAAGQKDKKRGPMKWFVTIEYFGCDADGYSSKITVDIVRGKSLDTVERRFLKSDMEFCKEHDYGGPYALAKYHVVNGPFDTKEAAEEHAKKCRDELCMVA